ncbi:DNA polymerase delta subunit 2 [Skeletonema marinoi]|uniref:DNA polymerase delta subunit 2 n=1 Tax=Skeletonema marinoi TaxID=267567 RepID=A0AAD8YBB5_9STRA|nr:DNA polymerase delta subunit 2 [Skeletonema marinoi]
MTSATTRAYAPFEPAWSRFHEFAAPLASSSGAGAAASVGESAQNSHPYNRQYSHVYSARLKLLRRRCIQNAQQSLKDDGVDAADVVERIIEVKEGALSILVGTIVKEMDPKRRPPVKSTYTDASAQTFLFPSDDKKAEKQEPLRSLMFDKDKGDVLHLEDESGRVELASDADVGDETKNANSLDPNKVATGVVAAVVGKVDSGTGVMHVHSIHFAGPPPVEKGSTKEGLRGASINDKEKNDPILLLVSGLGCGSDSPTDAETGASLSLRREMLLDYLTDPQLGDGSSICRVVVAGGGITAAVDTAEDKENTKKASSNNATKKSGKYDSTANVTFSLRELDVYITEILSAGIPVDYIPGWNDPTNANWPQRPLHSCLLPNSVGFVDLFRRSTNPYESDCSGVKVLGSDGLNVADLRRFLPKKCDGDDEVNDEGAESHGSNWTRLIANLPSSETDPFVMTSRPAVYFIGNCDEFEARLVGEKGETIDTAADDDATRLVCVPSFSSTGEVVLVNLRTLECDVVSFNDVKQ